MIIHILVNSTEILLVIIHILVNSTEILVNDRTHISKQYRNSGQ